MSPIRSSYKVNSAKVRVELAFAFEMNDKLYLVKAFLGTEFRIYSPSIDNGHILDEIEERTVDRLVNNERFC
jgi:hypothetical protein